MTTIKNNQNYTHVYEFKYVKVIPLSYKFLKKVIISLLLIIYLFIIFF